MAQRFGGEIRESPVDVGERAPEFTARWNFDRSVSLADTLAAGPVLLVFYVFDFGHF